MSSHAGGPDTVRLERIRNLAVKELENEDIEEAVRQEKRRLREKRGRSVWARLFPWKITIVRR